MNTSSSSRANVKRTTAKKTTKSARAGVLFPVGRLHRYLKQQTPKQRVSMAASVYTAAVMEYLAAEVLELSGNAARDNKRTRITPRHIFLAVSIDDELKTLLKGVTISQGGKLPYIHPYLLKTKENFNFNKPINVFNTTTNNLNATTTSESTTPPTTTTDETKHANKKKQDVDENNNVEQEEEEQQQEEQEQEEIEKIDEKKTQKATKGATKASTKKSTKSSKTKK